MDKETRNRIQRATQQARTLLEEDYERQLDGTYDIPKTGRVAETPGAHLEPWQVPIRQKLVAAVRHRQATGCRPAEAVAGCLREAAFTTLNRFVALKMLEARGLVQEALSKGEQSSGFREFTGLAPGLSGLPDHGYRLYLESLFDEIGQEVKVLFDRWDPASLLWPGHQAFQALLEILNQTDLAEVWKEDETIGWVYQYFNSDDERKKMRKESQAPRNSRELAVRNQFFTPRYVVEFLTDNTLGRTWYEMRQGETTLVDRCQYLVRRRRPVFMKPGEVGPEPFVPAAASPLPGSDEAAMWTRPNPDLETYDHIASYAATVSGYEVAETRLGRDLFEMGPEMRKAWEATGKWEGTFEELRSVLFYLWRSWDRGGGPGDPGPDLMEAIRSLYQEICRRWDLETEHIPFRAKKDPRDLKILDPACGSGHFLLYCFDLLVPIYEEAWADESSPRSEATGHTLRQDCATLEDLRAAVPGLVLRHNLHGIDIDPRAAQIAALALWMRAQRAYGDFQLPRSARPPIRKTNIVVAEPMPGEPELRQEFLATLERPLAGLVEKVFQKMELAGEAGSLLRIEEDIRDAIRDARKTWQSLPRSAQLSLEGFEPKGQQLHLQELWEVSDEGYWEQAERRVYEALERYAGSGRNGGAFQRRLFADDAARGFAFVDLCRQRYDVVLMNPPFGEPSNKTVEMVTSYKWEWNANLLCAFIIRTADLLSLRGHGGAIYDRTANIKTTYEQFRRTAFFGATPILLACDLGWEVLEANVEVSCSTFYRRNLFDNIDNRMIWGLNATGVASNDKQHFLAENVHEPVEVIVSVLKDLLHLPNAIIGHHLPAFAVRIFSRLPSLSHQGAKGFNGHTIKSDTFFRCWWEAPPAATGTPNDAWAWMYNGGEYSRHYLPYREVVCLGTDGRLLAAHPSTIFRNISLQGSGQIGVGCRGEFADAHYLPQGFISTVEGQAVSVASQHEEDTFSFLAIMNCSTYQYLINLFCGQHKYSGYLNATPTPSTSNHSVKCASLASKSICQEKEAYASTDETSPSFSSPAITATEHWTLDIERRAHSGILETIRQADSDLNRHMLQAYGLTEAEARIVQEFGRRAPSDKYPPPVDSLDGDPTRKMASYLVGGAFGRFKPTINRHSKCAPSHPTFAQPASGGVCPERECVQILEHDSRVNTDSDRDITWRIRRFGQSAFHDHWESIRSELDSNLYPFSLETYIREPTGFFDDHIARYSVGRRKAPIYWQLSTPSASYSVWLYYHRLTRDTFYQVLNDFVVPKLRHEEARLTELRQEAGPSPTSQQRKDMDAQETFVEELRAYREEVQRVAPLWNPNLNDGVIINFAPLWRLVPQHREWQRECRECWNKLTAGDYDWAHLAMHLWPERVVPKCATDRSLAIAHDLEEVFWQEGTDGKWRPKPASPETVARLVAERTSPAVRDARDKLLAAPEPVGRRGGRRAASTPRAPRSPRAPRPTAPEPTTAPTPRARATANPQAREAILRHLATTPTGAAKSELLAATALDESTWKPTIDELLAQGQVTRTGEKRGTRYHLASNG